MIGIYVLLFLLMVLIVKFLKGKLKVILAVLVILCCAYCILLNIDMNMVNTFREPIFAKENGHMGSMIRYDGLGYKVGLEKDEYSNIVAGQLTIFDWYLVQVYAQIQYADPIEQEEIDKYVFGCEVVEVNGNTIIVKPDEDTNEIKSSDKISINVSKWNSEFIVGDKLEITYNGLIKETYPAQITAIDIQYKK